MTGAALDPGPPALAALAPQPTDQQGVGRHGRGLVEQVAPSGRCDFVAEFGLRFPTEAFLGVIGVDPKDADRFVPWVEDFFAGFGGDPAGLEPMAAALAGIREYWVA
ncbi:MAG TPA: hypothetical protein VF743_11190, partial [Acidimicrobiales bacterium]